MERERVIVEVQEAKLDLSWESALRLKLNYSEAKPSGTSLIISAHHTTEFPKFTPVLEVVFLGDKVRVQYPHHVSRDTQIFVNGALWDSGLVWETDRPFEVEVEEFAGHPRVLISV